MEMLKQYFDLQNKIFEYFGYVEDWKIIPLDDATQYYWRVVEYVNGNGKGEITYSDKPLTKESIEAGADTYSSIIYTQRFLPKFIYRTEDYTMISVDTQTDGNKLLMVFDNKKEQPEMCDYAFTGSVPILIQTDFDNEHRYFNP